MFRSQGSYIYLKKDYKLIWKLRLNTLCDDRFVYKLLYGGFFKR